MSDPGQSAALRRPLRLLLVEDSAPDAELIVATLKRAGYSLSFEVVDAPEEYARRVQSGNFDIILSDHNLRSWTGHDALQTLRTLRKDIPFVVVTATLGDEAAVDYIKRGAADYVLKHRLDRLPVVVGQALRENAHRSETARLHDEILAGKREWELTFDAVPDIILLLNKEGRVRRANQAASRILGKAFSEMIGHPCYEVVHGLEEPRPDCPHHRLLETGMEERADIEEPRLKKVFDATGSPLRDAQGGLSGCTLLMRDVTERKRAEAERIRLMTAVEQSADAVFITDAEGVIQYVNPAFTNVTGYSRNEALGKKSSLLRSGQHDNEFYQALWNTILAGNVWTGEIINRRKDNVLYHEQTTITPVRDGHGQVTHFIATKRDITERKRLEEQLRQAQKMEAIGRLAGGVAHDFNNLLTVIMGFGQLLRERGVQGEPARKHVEEIIRAAQRAADLTRQLLAFGRRQVLQPRSLDLNAVVAGTEKMLRRLIGEDIDLMVLPGEELGKVFADPAQIEQVIMNLVVNSRDAMPRGGKLTLETGNVELGESYATQHISVIPGRYVVLAVSDTGFGMDAETQSHIFEPFFTTKEIGKGTGLGLATVYGIVKQSGGHVWVYSEPNQGATFKVYFPRHESVEEKGHARATAAPARGGQETILVVEDEDSVRSLVRQALESKGYTVIEANRGDRALEVAANHQGAIHLLLTDVVMPGVNGRELATKLASLRPEVKVLYMSGYTDDTVVRHGALDSGLNFLQKPFTPEGVALMVRQVLDTA